MKYIRSKQLAEHLSVNQSTIWRWVKKGHLPRPIRLGSNTVVWNSKDIEDYLDKKAREVK